jgi:hypothetical protein
MYIIIFLDIGADDGIRFSNCNFFEEILNCNSITINARTNVFNNLIKNRKCLCENIVLSDTEETTNFLDIKGYGLGLSGLVKKYDKRHVKRIKHELKNNNSS